MADTIIERGEAETVRLDTISDYDDSEPKCNERPYFSKVEEKRGRTGWHVNVGAQNSEERLEPEPVNDVSNHRFTTSPGSDGRSSPQLRACLTSQGNRVILSGIGGDEVMGGVPTPAPELQDLLVTAQFGKLTHQLKAWALQLRKPWVQLFWGAVRDLLPMALIGVPKWARPAPWLQATFAKRYSAALAGYPKRVRVFGQLPSFQANIEALEALRRQLTSAPLPFGPTYEKRYPYLDRDLLEFMYAIPREQLVRPTQRRSLMRRALAGIVPDEILNRKSKAFVARAPMVGISNDWARLVEITQDMVCNSLGIVDSIRLQEMLQKARRGEDELPMIPLMRTLLIEGWIKDIGTFGVVNLDTTSKRQLAWQGSAQG
jgi:asparagine synthase (glutamine-hydrolysing)